jgi:hypothetical protein
MSRRSAKFTMIAKPVLEQIRGSGLGAQSGIPVKFTKLGDC